MSALHNQQDRCRQFWHAGDYRSNSGSQLQASQPTADQLDRARVHPKFLHSNATSHKWALGAVAELLDNSVDEIAHGCTFVALDIESDGSGSHLMSVLDDGGGMNRAQLHNMLSFGMSTGQTATRIGQYGNGFKTSSMRLGADALVLTVNAAGDRSAGLLSYSMLRGTAAEEVLVPITCWDKFNCALHGEAGRRSLQLILEWSPYKTEQQLLEALGRVGAHGTLLLIYNLWESDAGQTELDWVTDPTDIRLRPADAAAANTSKKRNKGGKYGSVEQQEAIHEKYYGWRHSLRSYASLLYRRLPAGFEVRLRGIKVQLWDLAAELIHGTIEHYQPRLPALKPGQTPLAGVYPISMGFVPEAPDAAVMGYLVYHRNRLIKCMWETYSSASSCGRGVLGVVEVDFVAPAHDKQDFERTDLFARLEMKLKMLTPAFWKANGAKVG